MNELRSTPGSALRQRGTCSKCGYRQDLRRDGMVGTHPVYYGHDRHVCEGSGLPEKYAAVNAAAREAHRVR